MSVPDWLSRYFEQPTIRDGAGADMPSRSNIKFPGCTVSDDAANDQTIVTPGSAINVMILAHDADAVFPALGPNNALVILESLSANRTIPIPTLVAGQSVTIRDRDGSIALHDFIVTASVQIRIGANLFSSPYRMTAADFEPGFSMKLEFDGTELVSI